MEESKKNMVEFEQIWFYRKEARDITNLSNTRTHEHINRMVDHEILTSRRDGNGISYRFLVKPQDDGSIDRLNLVRMSEVLKHASKKERQEYEAFKLSLEEIFKALNPKYNGEGV
jgi:predicted transcriptional regulator